MMEVTSPAMSIPLVNKTPRPLCVEEEMKITMDKWPELSQEGKVTTRQFLQCSNLVVKFIDSLGVAFTPVARDVEGNTKKLMTKYIQDPERYNYLEDMLEDDLHLKNRTTTEALLWLKRGLNFLCTFLELLITDYENGIRGESLVPILRASYEATLSIYHGFILRQLFNILCQAAPARSQLIHRLLILVKEQDRETLMSDLKIFTNGLRVNLQALYSFYREKQLVPF